MSQYERRIRGQTSILNQSHLKQLSDFFNNMSEQMLIYKKILDKVNDEIDYENHSMDSITTHIIIDACENLRARMEPVIYLGQFLEEAKEK